MTDNTFKNCVTGDRVMTMLDDHQECFLHRACNATFSCKFCRLCYTEKRATIERMIEKARARLVSATATTESVASVGNPATLPTASSVGSFPSQHAPRAGMHFVQSPLQPPLMFHAPISSDLQKQQEMFIDRLYTTIPHQKLKSRLATLIRNSFLHKNGNRRYKYLVLGREGLYFVKEHSDSKNKYIEEDIIKMLEFLVDNIFVVFAGKVFQQIIGIPMGTNCAPLLADIFLYSYEAKFIQSLLSAGKRRLASQFNFTYRYIDDVLSINNPDFENYLGQMYPPELEIKDTTESNTSASYLDLLLSIGRGGQLHTSLYDKRDDFNFHITNFPFLSINIPSSPAYGVFISQLIRYAWACSSYEWFILRAMRLSNKLLGQGYVRERLKSSLRKFYGRYGDLTKQYDVPLSRMLHDILDDDHIQ